MKKSVKILLSMLCLTPLALCACQNSSYYQISALPSSSALGSVSGYSQEKVAEGSTVTLTARENNEGANPLLAWVKNNEYLVKIANHSEDARDNTLELTVGADTEGKYTAVFAENPSAIKYAYVAQTSFGIFKEITDEEPVWQNPDTFSYNLSYAIKNAGSSSFLPYEDKIGDGVNTNILYFGGLGQNNEFKFRVELSFNIGTEENPQIITYTNTNSTWISRTNFVSVENLYINELNFAFKFNDGTNDKNGVFNIILAKFSPEMNPSFPQQPTE